MPCDLWKERSSLYSANQSHGVRDRNGWMFVHMDQQTKDQPKTDFWIQRKEILCQSGHRGRGQACGCLRGVWKQKQLPLPKINQTRKGVKFLSKIPLSLIMSLTSVPLLALYWFKKNLCYYNWKRQRGYASLNSRLSTVPLFHSPLTSSGSKSPQRGST